LKWPGVTLKTAAELAAGLKDGFGLVRLRKYMISRHCSVISQRKQGTELLKKMKKDKRAELTFWEKN